MLQVIAGGVIALVSGWILDGGLRRRSRRTIREEFELAELLKGRPGAEALLASADERLERYVTPFWTRVRRLQVSARVIVLVGATIVLAGSGLGLWLGRDSFDQQQTDNFAGGIGAGVAIGAIAIAMYQFLDRGLIPLSQQLVQLTLGLSDSLAQLATTFSRLMATFPELFARQILFGRRHLRGGDTDDHAPKDPETDH